MSINKIDDKWKKAFKCKFEDYKYPARDGMWEDIVNSLPQSKKASKRPSAIWIGTAAAIFTAIIVLAGPHIIDYITSIKIFKTETENIDYNKQKGKQQNSGDLNIQDINFDEGDEKLVDTTDNHNAKNATIDTDEKKAPIGKLIREEHIQTKNQDKHRKTHGTDTSMYVGNIIAKDEVLQSAFNLNADSLKELSTPSESSIKPVDTLNVLQHENSDEMIKEVEDDVKQVKPKKDYSSWSFAISSKNIVYNGYHKQWGEMKAPTPPANTDYVVGWKKQFSHPLNINLTVRKQLNSRWAIEGGLSYTYLWSKETIINSLSPATDTHIKIHNIGIPIGAEYMFYNSRKINIYSKYGIMIEKTKESNNRIKDWQVSTWLSGGLSYRLGKKTGIFLDPGLTYYFNNNTAVPTLRNEVSLNFDITIGLRFYPFSH